MRNVPKIFIPFTLALFMLSVSGCSYFSRPSDETVIKAVKESRFLNPAAGGVTLRSPIVILERGRRNRDGSWPVKVKFSFTFVMSNGQNSKLMEKTPMFRIYKAGKAGDQNIWKAQLGV